jgi:DNA-binding MarR family transcriptional regulator
MLSSPTGSSRAPVPPTGLAAWRAFLEAHARVSEVLGRELREREDLPLTWYDVLVQLSEAEGHRLRMQELADAVLLSKSGLTRLVDRMESEGLVRRRPCDDDRRGTLAELTETGYQRLADTAPTHLEGVRAHFVDLLDEEETRVLEAALARVAEHARNRSVAPPPAPGVAAD